MSDGPFRIFDTNCLYCLCFHYGGSILNSLIIGRVPDEYTKMGHTNCLINGNRLTREKNQVTRSSDKLVLSSRALIASYRFDWSATVDVFQIYATLTIVNTHSIAKNAQMCNKILMQLHLPNLLFYQFLCSPTHDTTKVCKLLFYHICTSFVRQGAQSAMFLFMLASFYFPTRISLANFECICKTHIVLN